MSTSMDVANAELVKILQDNEDHILSLTKSKAVDLSKEMFESCVISDCNMEQISRLDHSRVEPQLQLRYLLRLVTKRIQQDTNAWAKFLSVLERKREHSLCDFLSRSSLGEEKLSEMGGVGMNDSLSIDDLKWVLEALVKVSPEWEMLATALDLPFYKIQNSKEDKNIKSLRNVLIEWLSGDSTTPTISILTQALRSKLVGQGRLAQEVEEQFKSLKASDIVSSSKRLDTSSLAFTIIKQSSREVEVEDGKSTLLLVQASQKENVSYQWNKNGQPLAECASSYSGVHDDILVINHADQGTVGVYTCCVSCQERRVTSNKVTLTVLYVPEKKKLLDLYAIQSKVPLDNPWPPVGTESFIKVTLIKTQETSANNVESLRDPDKTIDGNKQVDYENVFGTYKKAALTLVEGRPGSGKTTFVHRIVKDWAKGKALFQAKLVFLVSLRVFSTDDSPKDTLSSILHKFYSNDEDLKAVISDMEKLNGEGICFIFDGLDEYHHHEHKSVVFQLIHKSYLTLAMIIVSSRPGAMTRLPQNAVTQHIEVIGFTKNQIYEYIDKFPFDFSSDFSFGPAQLKEYLRSHPNVLHMCYLPIHVAIICFVYKTKRGHLPNTQTKIYEEFARSMILRHVKQNHPDKQIVSLQKLPKDINKYFDELCSLAFKMTVDFVQVININEIEFSFHEEFGPCGDWSLGLVTCNRTAQLSGFNTYYTFLHLTLQEYLAAYHIANTEGESNKRKLLAKVYSQHKKWKFITFWDFYFGLENFESINIPENIMGSMVKHAFESQQPKVSNQLVKNREGVIKETNLSLSLVPALLYTICTSSQHVVVLSLSFQEVSGLHDVLQQIQNSQLQELEVLILYNPIYDHITLKYLSNLLQLCTKLKIIDFRLCDLTVEGREWLAEGLQHLTDVDNLTIRYTSSYGIKNFLNAIPHFKGNELKLDFKDLIRNGSLELASGLQSLADKTIKKISLKYRYSEEIELLAIIKQIHCLNNVKSLKLDYSRMNFTCCEAFATSISACHLNLENLNLSENDITSDSVIALASGLQYLKNLQDLSLSGNDIDVRCAIQIILALKDCQELTLVRLDKCLELYDIYPGFHLRGIVEKEDTASIDSLVAAVRQHRKNADIHLGIPTKENLLKKEAYLKKAFRTIHVSCKTQSSDQNLTQESKLCACQSFKNCIFFPPIVYY